MTQQLSTNAGSPDGALPIAVREVALAELKPASVNPHHMRAEVYNRLVKNIQRDGVLSSVPLVHEETDGTLRILSGHHRVRAAIDAGVVRAFCMVITGMLTEQRLRAIQLSHNALVGEDDMAHFQKLWTALPVDEQLYSGLTDATFKLLGDLPDLTNLRPVTGNMQTLNFVFLPADRDIILEAVRKAGNRKNTTTIFAEAQAFDAIFAGLVEVKDRRDLMASSLALLVLVELAMQRLRELDAQAEAEAGAPPEDSAQAQTT